MRQPSPLLCKDFVINYASDIIASGIDFVLRSADAFCAKAKRQRQQHDVGHSGVFTGCECLNLSSSISEDVCTPTEIS